MTRRFTRGVTAGPRRGIGLLALATLLPVGVQVWSVLAQAIAVRSGEAFGRRNLEASYHVLLTIRALRRAPLGETLGLPIVTLGQQNDKWIGWGATIPNGFGDQVYTSFPPLGFWVPLLASLPLAEPGLVFLTVFNGLLGLLTALLIVVLTFAVARSRQMPGTAAAVGAATAGTLYVLSPEVVQSQGVVYWPQSLSQLFLVALALVLHRRARGLMPRSAPWVAATLIAASCYTEWTGFVTALLVAAVCVASSAWRHRMARSAVGLLLGASAAGCILLLQFAAQVGIGPAFAAWTTRAGGRSASSLPALMYGWTLSAGATVLALVIVVLVLIAKRISVPATNSTAVNAADVILIAALISPVAENLLLQQHAAQFSFDRLKIVVPIAVASGVLVAAVGSRVAVMAAAVSLVVAAVVGQQMQAADEAYYAAWPSVDASNRALVRDASAQSDFSCATIGSSGIVRGYLNLLFDRSIVESTTLADLQNFHQKNPCGYVYITAVDAFTDLPAISSIRIVNAHGDRTLDVKP